MVIQLSKTNIECSPLPVNDDDSTDGRQSGTGRTARVVLEQEQDGKRTSEREREREREREKERERERVRGEREENDRE